MKTGLNASVTMEATVDNCNATSQCTVTSKASLYWGRHNGLNNVEMYRFINKNSIFSKLNPFCASKFRLSIKCKSIHWIKTKPCNH